MATQACVEFHAKDEFLHSRKLTNLATSVDFKEIKNDKTLFGCLSCQFFSILIGIFKSSYTVQHLS